jgi:hypothetical protein
MVKDLVSNWLSQSQPEINNLLRVPFDYQPESEDECVVYCLWMVIHYFKNKHPAEDFRIATNSLSPDELLEDMTVVKGGWKPDQDELTVISERTQTLQFHLDYWQDGSPQPLFEILTENIDEGRPVIPFINGPRLREGKRETDGIHSVVAAGYDNRDDDDVVAIHDPWGYPEDVVTRPNLEDAWDPMFNQVITVTLSTQGKKIVGGSR